MPGPLADWHMVGAFPLQDFDEEHGIGRRTTPAGVRLHKPQGDELHPDQRDTQGDWRGCFLAMAAKGQREQVNAWFLGGAGYVQSAGTSKAAAQSTTTRVSRAGGPKGGNSWHPILKQGEPDTRLEPDVPALPDFLAKQKYPRFWTGVVTQGVAEHEQNTQLHPAFLGLVSVNKGGDPECGTLVHELDDNGEVELSARLQSIFTVTDLGGGACGAAGKVVALQLGKSKQDKVSGHLPMVEWLGPNLNPFTQSTTKGPDKVTAIFGQGMPFLTGGVADQHRIGVDADGDPINAGHLSTGALFKGPGGDAPLAFTPQAWVEPVAPADGVFHEVFLRNRPVAHSVGCASGKGLWSWQLPLPMFTPPPKDGDPPPPPADILVQPWPGPGELIGDGRPETGSPEIPGPYNGEPVDDPKYVGFWQCLLAYGGLAFPAMATAEGEANFTGRGAITQAAMTAIGNAPVAGVLQGYVGANTQWFDMPTDDTFTNTVLEAPASGRKPAIAVVPAGESLKSISDGDAQRLADWMIPASTGGLVLGDPNEENDYRNSVVIQGDGSGDADVTFYDSSGTQTSTEKLSDAFGGGVSGEPGQYNAPYGSGAGAPTGDKTHEEVLSDGGGGTVLTTATAIPTGCTIKHVRTYVIADFDGTGTGAGDGYLVGITADQNKWGATTAISAGTTTGRSDYTADPRLYITGSGSSDGHVRIYSNAFQFDGGGSIRVVITYEDADDLTE